MKEILLQLQGEFAHDRDFPSKFILQLLMKEAQLRKLGFGLLKNRARRRPGSSPSR